MLVVSMVVYLLRLGCCLTTTSSTRYAANFQTPQTPDSVIARFDGSDASGNITASFATHASGTTGASTRDLSIATGSGKDTITISNLNSDHYKTISVNTGAGDDKVVVGTALSSKMSINGGAGKDTLSIDIGASAPTVNQVALVNNQTSNFEVMEFATTAVTSLNASSFTGFTDYVFTQAATATTAITALTSANKFTFEGNLTGGAGSVGGASPIVAATAALSLGATGSAQTASIIADAASTLAITGGIGGVGAADAANKQGQNADEAIAFSGGVTTLMIVADSAVDIIGGAGGKGGEGGANAVGSKGGNAAAAIENGTAVKTLVIEGDSNVKIIGGSGGAKGDAGGGKDGGAGGDANTNGFTGAITVNASTLSGNLTIQGSTAVDTIIGGKGDDDIRAGASNDVINISAGGSNTIRFETTAKLNGTDSVIGFKVGATSADGDVLAVSGFTGIGSVTAITSIASNSAAATLADDSVNIVKFSSAIADKDFGGADFADLFGSGKVFAAAVADATEGVIVVQGTDVTHVYFVNEALVDNSDDTVVAGDISLVAILEGVTASDTLVAANFA